MTKLYETVYITVKKQQKPILMAERTAISLQYRIWPYFYIRKDSENNRRCENVYEKLVWGQKNRIIRLPWRFRHTIGRLAARPRRATTLSIPQ